MIGTPQKTPIAIDITQRDIYEDSTS